MQSPPQNRADPARREANGWRALLADALRPPPPGWLRWGLPGLPLGWLSPDRLALLQAVLPGCRLHAAAGLLIWEEGQGLAPAERSLRLQRAALQLRAQGLVPGWRDEAYACEQPVDDPTRQRGAELFRLERAAFRVLGLMSRAAHVNGFRPDGRLWCGRRAASKATDPGLLDNLAAGGLPAGEALADCARRELFEEAGVPAALSAGLRAQGAVRVRRPVAEGLHDEVLQVYRLELPMDFVPRNQDGEVSEFLCLTPVEALARCQAGEFTPDAAAVLACGLLGR